MNAYTNLISCGYFGCSLTAELKKNRYIIIGTNSTGNCKKEHIRKEGLEEQFSSLLSNTY